MAIDISALKPVKTQMAVTRRGRAAADHGPNPFLDKDMADGLWWTYLNGEARGVQVDGTIETYKPVVREHLHEWAQLNGHVNADGTLKGTARDAYLAAHGGQGEGPEKERVTGDAAVVVKWLRDAADKMEIGVSIQFEAGKRKGSVLVKYQGQERKQTKKSDN